MFNYSAIIREPTPVIYSIFNYANAIIPSLLPQSSKLASAPQNLEMFVPNKIIWSSEALTHANSKTLAPENITRVKCATRLMKYF